MKILVITQYFYPENFRINDLCYSLKERGNEVTVLTGKPNYPNGEYYDGYNWSSKSYEIINEIEVFRSNLILRKSGKSLNLVLNYISFVFFGIARLFSIKKRFDKILIYAPSPITVGLIGIVAKYFFKSRTFLWVHDLWPESVKIAGNINNNIILNIVDLMTRLIYRYSDLIMVQSPLFKDYIHNQGVKYEKIKFYPYYAEDFYKPLELKEKNIYPEGHNIIFAGNIGVAQSFDTIISAALELKKNKIKINFIIIGEGRDKTRIQNLIKENDIEPYFYFLGAHPPEKMARFFYHADALLVSLKKSKIFFRTIPGKLQSYLACSKPIIGSIDGIAGNIIKESNCGFCSPAEDAKKLSDIIVKFINLSVEDRDKLGKNALNYYNQHFKKDKLLLDLENIFKEN